MSECVVRMEMPKNCINCDLRYECNAFYASRKHKPFMKGCMIVCQLPKGHGRLADMNDVERMFEAAQIISDDDCNCGYVTDDLRLEELPTIVPAEAERSET